MREMIEIIDSALRHEDIEGLIDAGAPADEYTSEAERIAIAVGSLAPEKITEDNVLAIISLAWMQNFNLGEEEMRLRVPALRRVVQRILH